MICVSLGRTRHKMMLAEHRALAERGVHFVELRLDWLRRTPDLSRLLTDRPTPAIVTCRRPEDGGRWRGTEEQRMMLLRQAIVDGADYVDLEEDVAAKIPRYGKTKRIVSHHDFKQTPDDPEEIYDRLSELDADVIKIVTMANSPRDNVRMMRLLAEAEQPTVAFCMGEFGLPSRVLCGKYGAPWTYATFNRDRELAPGQLVFDDMREIYHYDQIDGGTRVYGVVGDPVAHSLSPLIHNAAFAAEGLNCVYLPFRIPADEFQETFEEFTALDVRGYSVTIPHKETAAEIATYPDDAVRTIGAANTLYRDDRGRWVAANTDYDAAVSTLRLGLEQKDVSERLHGKSVLLLGAGGVAKAIGLAVVRSDAALTITNRTKKRGRALAEQLGCKFVNWENRGSEFADILINCTPVGMFPDMDETPYAEHWLREGMLVFDTIYNPENTLLLKQARERGCVTVSGLEMFVRQAAAQFECFMQAPAPLDVMRQALRRGISPVHLKSAPASGGGDGEAAP